MTPINRKRKQCDGGVSRRKVNTRPIRRKFLIACEGDATEPLYFESLCRELLLSTDGVRAQRETGHGDPKGIVEYVKGEYRKAKRDPDLRSLVSPSDFWCVFDRDDHAKLHEAIQQARDNHFGVAFSNPCFELWYILHHKEHTAPMNQDKAIRKLKEHIADYHKSMDVYSLLPEGSRQEAINRARALRERHTTAGDPETHNPSTSVDLLVEYLLAVSEEQKQKG